jgi:hypothetical protein
VWLPRRAARIERRVPHFLILLYFNLMDDEIENELRPELAKDERLLWTGRPRTGLLFQPYDAVLIPFSLFWCGMITVIFYSSMANSRNGAPLIFISPFLLVGLYLLFGRFYVDSQRRKNTVYGITENRIIIRSGIWSRAVKSFNIKVLPNLTLREKRDGTGTIYIGTPNSLYMMSSNMAATWPGVPRIPSLESVPEVRKIYQLILQLQQKQTV